MRIQFLCDHKWRDLPNIATIKVTLEQKGHRVLITTTKDGLALANLFRPDAMVFNHMFGNTYRTVARALKKDGRMVIVLPTEGAMRPEYVSIAAGEFSDYSDVDLLLAWSEAAASDIRQRWGVGADVAPVAGCTRFDFHHERFHSLVSTREEFCRRNDLDPDCPIVTWATAYGYAHLHGNNSHGVWAQLARETGEVGVAECLRRIGIEVKNMPRLFAEGRERCAAAFFQLARALPEIQFVLKPHPVENLEFYRGHIRKNALENVRFCHDDYIWNILRATDVHLHRQCTTAVEAWMWDKPTIEMGMDHQSAWEWPEREAGSFIARSDDELVELVRYSLGTTIDPALSAYRRSYIHRWFGPADGHRCEAAGCLIDAALNSRTAKPWVRPLLDLPIPPRQQLRAAIGYAADLTPGQPLVRRQGLPLSGGLGSEDRHIRRSDVARYCQQVGSIMGTR